MRKAAWIGGTVLVVAAAMAFAVTRPSRDDYATLRSYITSDEVSYYSAKDSEKVWDEFGGSSPMPPLQDSSLRFVKLRSVPVRDLLAVAEKIVGDRQLMLYKKKKQGLVAAYTSSGTITFGLGDHQSLTVWIRSDSLAEKYRGSSIFELRNLDLRVNAEFMDTRLLSLWDKVRLRANHAGRIPFSDPTTE